MSSAPALSQTAPPPGYAARWFVMTVVIIADVMDLVDSTVAQLAGPSIRKDIGGSETTLQWILAAYTLTFAVGLITSARLGDVVGRRQMFILGMGGFTVASLACGLAPTATTLIIARVIQGLFGATMIPQGFALVKQSFPEDELQKAFIPFGPIMGLSAVLGPILGGFLIDADIWGSGWRAIFLINIPIGLVGTYIAWRRLPDMPRTPGVRLDPVGSILISIAAGGLIYALVQGRDLGWPTWLNGVIAGAAVVFAIFVWSERRSDHPIIEPSLFTHRGFVAGLVFLGLFFLSMVGVGLILSLFMQLGLGYSAQHAAIAQTPYALGLAVGAALSGALLGPKLGRHVLHIGLALTMVGMLWFGAIAGGLEQGASAWHLTLPFLLTGFGSGLIFAPLFDIVLADLGDHEVGSGSGLLNAVQQFAGALGVAVLGTVFFHWLPEHGFGISTRWVVWVTIGCYAAAFCSAFLLPMRAKTREGAIAH